MPELSDPIHYLRDHFKQKCSLCGALPTLQSLVDASILLAAYVDRVAVGLRRIGETGGETVSTIEGVDGGFVLGVRRFAARARSVDFLEGRRAEAADARSLADKRGCE